MSDFFFSYSGSNTLGAKVRSIADQMKVLNPYAKVIEHATTRSLLVLAVNEVTPLWLEKQEQGFAMVLGFVRGQGMAAVRKSLEDPRMAFAACRDLCKTLNYGAAVVCSAEGEITVTADYLGLYPLFFIQNEQGFACSSTPVLLSLFPGFRKRESQVAAVSGFLLSHHFGGHAVWEGMQRLPAHTVLTVDREGRIELKDVPLPNPVPGGVDSDLTESFHQVLQETFKGFLSQGIRGALLSGGLDSRMIAGYIQEATGPSFQGFVVGSESDYDVKFGSAVIHKLGCQRHLIEVDDSFLMHWADEETLSDALESGLYSHQFRCLVEGLKTCPTPVFTGLLGDSLVGYNHINWAWDPAYKDFSFETLFRNVNEFGIPQRVIRRVMRFGHTDEIVEDLVTHLRHEFESYPGEPWQKAWWFDLHHRQRYLIGRVAKLIAIRSWPVMPFVDYDVLKAAAALPLQLAMNRRLQYEVVCRKFRSLAKLPLDRDGADKRSLMEGMREPRMPYLFREVGRLIWHSVHHRLGRGEVRFYVRMFDLNSPGWRQVRTRVQACLRDLPEWLSAEEIGRLVPDGSQELKLPNLYRSPTGRKRLMATLLWFSRENGVR